MTPNPRYRCVNGPSRKLAPGSRPSAVRANRTPNQIVTGRLRRRAVKSSTPSTNTLVPANRRTYVPNIGPGREDLGVVDLYDAASFHQLSLQAAGRSSGTMRIYLIYEKRFLEFLESRGLSADLEALSPLNVRKAVLWFQQRQIGKRGGATATAYFLNVLKTWASFLEQEGVWQDSPIRKVKRVKVRKLERQAYTRTEVNAMLHACELTRTPKRDQLLLLLLLDTGARIGEATGMGIGDFRVDRRQARVLGKGNRERTIPIGATTVSDGGPLFRAFRAYVAVRELQVKRWPDRSGNRLFLTPQGYPLGPEGGTEVVKRIGDLAGVEGAIPHRFRHTFATVYLVNYPGDEMGLRRIMGHLSREALADYVHLANQIIAQRAGRVAPTQNWLREAEA
jgi:site-specific recombinase XerD